MHKEKKKEKVKEKEQERNWIRGKKGRCACKMLESCLLDNTTKTLLKKCQKSKQLLPPFRIGWLEAAFFREQLFKTKFITAQIEKYSFQLTFV